MKAPRSVKRITFNPSEANPGETLNVHMPKLNKNEVLGSLVLRFDIDISGGHASNFLVQNVSRALVSQLVVKFEGMILEDRVDYDDIQTFSDLFLLREKRDNMVLEDIQSKDLCKIRSGLGDKKTSGVDVEKKLNKVYSTKYRVNLNHQILTDHGIFCPQALYNDLVFEVTFTPTNQVVTRSDSTKLKHKLTNIQLEYEMIHSEMLAEEASSVYDGSKEFVYDHVCPYKIYPINRETNTIINITVNSQRRFMKGLLLLFVEPYSAGTRDSEKYIFPDLKKVRVTINGLPNMLYNGIESDDIWTEVSRFFMKEKHKPQFMTLKKFYTDNKFGLLIDLCSMAKKRSRWSRNAWQRHLSRKHHKQQPAGDRLRRQGNKNC